MVRYSGRDFLTADECVSKVESSGIEVQEIRIHRWRTTGPNCSMMTPDEQPYFSHPPTDKQEQEAGQYIPTVVLSIQRPVASGQRPDAPWETAQVCCSMYPASRDRCLALTLACVGCQSSDALVFFVDWLICSVDDVARARFFLSASEAQMEQELDSNLDVYTRDDGGER
eukprot:3936009-Rhodomonas_salina.1